MKRNSVTALVEFEHSDSARKAKQALNGCDVYSGCCTLKIEFASVSDGTYSDRRAVNLKLLEKSDGPMLCEPKLSAVPFPELKSNRFYLL